MVVTAVKGLVGALPLSSHGAPAAGSCSAGDFTPFWLRLMAGNLTISPAALRVSQWRAAFHSEEILKAGELKAGVQIQPCM